MEGLYGDQEERGIQKLPIEAFHENYKSSLLFILILEDGCVIPFLCISFLFFFFCKNWRKRNRMKNKSTKELQ